VNESPNHPVVGVDFQNADPDGRVRLNTVGTLVDIEGQSIELQPGLRLLLVDAELWTAGQVAWSDEEKLWVAEVDWNEVIPPADGGHS
jgi:hypothetical protein